MKRVLSLLLVTCLLLGLFAGCTDETSGFKDEIPGSTELKTPRLEQDIAASSIVSEGIAVVCCDPDSGVYYGINLNGEILFELEGLSTDFSAYYLDGCKYTNGIMEIDGGICDMRGNMTYPDEVGATHFYCQALEEGYILADVITADYQGTKSEMGILNTELEWVVKPNETLYQELMVSNTLVFDFISGHRHDGYYCYDGYLYMERLNAFLDLQSGEVVNSSEGPADQPDYSWILAAKGRFEDRNGTVMVDISEHTNLYYTEPFINGIAPVIFCNKDVNQYYLTAVDRNGEFLFDPVVLSINMQGFSVDTDGTVILVCEKGTWSEVGRVQTFDLQGNLLGEIDAEALSNGECIHASVEEGVVRLDSGIDDWLVWLFTPEFDPLF